MRNPTFKDVVTFILMFAVCIVGAVGIFVFAIGLENGNRVVNQAMQTLIDNAWSVIIFLVFINVVVLAVWRFKKK